MNPFISCILLLLVLTACHRDPQSPQPVLRQDYTSEFAAGTRFAIAKQSYPSHRNKRIVTQERVLIEKQIKAFLKKYDFIYDPDAGLVISFYREYYNPETEGPLDVHVKMLMKSGTLQYALRLDGIEVYNDRDGALILDIVQLSDARLLRQVAIPYYFGLLQKSLRESRDLEDIDYVPPINLLVPSPRVK